jgi:predicted NodU family carbamoyl transferase
MNTSFNALGSPIVDTPEDALATFKKINADVIYINGKRYQSLEF